MEERVPRPCETNCSRCFVPVARAAAVYGDHNRRYCSDACARVQLDRETGVLSRVAVGHSDYASANPAGPDDRATHSRGPRVRVADACELRRVT